MKKKKIFNLILLDESGSMSLIKQPTLDGINDVIRDIKEARKKYPDTQNFISLVTFNSERIVYLHKLAGPSWVEEIDRSDFKPDGLTPLYDAMGAAFLDLKYSIEVFKDAKVLVTVVTDGEENASKEFTADSIRKMVDELELQGWTFTYIGANHDVEQLARSLSIKNTLDFRADAQGVKRMFSRERRARENYRRKIAGGRDEKTDFYTDSE